MSFCCGLFVRARRVKTEVPPVLVQFCRNVPHLGMLSSMAEVQEGGQLDCNGSICGLNYHHLHRTKHTVYGHGALPDVWQFQQNAVCGQCGEWPGKWEDLSSFSEDAMFMKCLPLFVLWRYSPASSLLKWCSRSSLWTLIITFRQGGIFSMESLLP